MKHDTLHGLDIQSVTTSLSILTASFMASNIDAHINLDDTYRVGLVVGHLGWVDMDLDCSTLCQGLLGLIGLWQNWQGNWAKWWNF